MRKSHGTPVPMCQSVVTNNCGPVFFLPAHFNAFSLAAVRGHSTREPSAANAHQPSRCHRRRLWSATGVADVGSRRAAAASAISAVLGTIPCSSCPAATWETATAPLLAFPRNAPARFAPRSDHQDRHPKHAQRRPFRPHNPPAGKEGARQELPNGVFQAVARMLGPTPPARPAADVRTFPLRTSHASLRALAFCGRNT